MFDPISRSFRKALLAVLAAVLVPQVSLAEEEPTISYEDPADWDNDGIVDDEDNCPFHANPEQVEGDREQGGDGRGDPCDNCPLLQNEDQADQDSDGFGDVCDNDRDGDFALNGRDSCPDASNPDQEDGDSDGQGDACDTDIDGDAVANDEDDCPFGEERGCFVDLDSDGVPAFSADPKDLLDNCPVLPNEDQSDLDSDAAGDACDPDLDGDEVPNPWDNCPAAANPDQADADRDGVGDVCDESFCYVIGGDVSNCLCYDEGCPFAVHTPPPQEILTKEPVQLHLFANRQGAKIEYEWRITGWPPYGQASIENAIGLASSPTTFEYRYSEGLEPFFEAREPGVYEISVVATIAESDEKFPGEEGQTATTTTLVEVVGPGLGGLSGCGCGQTGAGAGPPLLAYMMLTFAALLLALCRSH